MSGRWIFLGAAALFGILTAFVHSKVFIAVFLFLLLFLRKKKNFSARQLLLVISIFILFLARSDWEEERNITVLNSSKTVFDIIIRDFIIDGDVLIADGKERMYDEKLKIRYRI